MLAAKRTATFTESVIREMTRIANQHEAINLAQGFPDFDAPGKLKDGRPSSQGKIPPLWTSPTSEYGFGLFLDALEGHKSVGHGGAINGFNTRMETYPDQQVTIVVVANTSYPAAEKVGPMVAKALFKSLAIP